MTNDGEPGGTIGSGIVRMAVPGKHATHDIFVEGNAKGVRDLLGDARETELWVALLHLHDCRNQFRGWAFGAGFAAPGNSS